MKVFSCSKALSPSACLMDVAGNREDLWVKVMEQPKGSIVDYAVTHNNAVNRIFLNVSKQTSMLKVVIELG